MFAVIFAVIEELVGINYILLMVLICYAGYKFERQQTQIDDLERELEELKRKE